MAAEKKVLATAVHVDGEVYAAGTVPPAEISELITNPKAWTSGKAEPATSESEKGSSDDAKSEKKDKGKKDKPAKETATTAEGGDSGASTGALEKPPAVGAGSGAAEWLAYARSIGLTLADDAKKGEIVEAVNAHEASEA